MATQAEAEGHLFGNFHAYYTFNPASERLRFMDRRTSAALRKGLYENTLGTLKEAVTVMDVGCNEGRLSRDVNAPFIYNTSCILF
jgi:2-polyprenyl-3-methyl-5-hydroxy-6-metoxy-1,4-benzoquinol methylase